MKNAGANSYLYFPICNEAGIMGSLTPGLGGDLTVDKNHFILEPTSVENLHNNRNSRNFWLKFDDGKLRSATGNSVWQKAEEDEATTTVRAGLLWHEAENVIAHGEERITARILNFAPAENVKCEIMRVCLTNTGRVSASFKPVAVLPLYARSADNLRDHRHVTSLLHRIGVEEGGVRVKPTLSFDERGHLRNTIVYYVMGCDGSGVRPVEFYPTVMHVIGEGGDFERPLGLNTSEPAHTGDSFEGVEAVGGLGFARVTLDPGETREFIIVTGAASEAETIAPLERFGNSGLVEKVLEENKKYWLEKARAGLSACEGAEKIIAESVGVSVSDAKNYLLWVSAEPVLRRIYGCSFLPYHDYGKGGRGWRDLWQDCLALMLGDPSSVRDLLLNNFAGVRADGTNATIIGKEPGEFIADRNGIARVWMDHGLWTWITMKLYAELSGDETLFDTEQVYFKDRLAKRARTADDAFDPADGTKVRDASGRIYSGSLLEHMLLMHITVSCDVGDNGNMLLRGADWNDALDMADKKGESVAFTAAYAGNLKEMAAFLKKRGKSIELLEEFAELTRDLAELCREEIKENGKASVKLFAERKRKLLDDYCEKVRHTVSGKKTVVEAKELAGCLEAVADAFGRNIKEHEFLENSGFKWINGYYDNEGMPVESIEENRVMLTGAVFAIMSGIAEEKDVERMIATADKYLFDAKAGGYRLNSRFANEGEYARKLGRMFGFAYGSKENGAVFCHMAVMYAYALLTRGFREAALKVVSKLISQSMDFAKSRIYPGIPEYFDPEGRGMYPYLTGAASWLLLLLYKLVESQNGL